MKSKTTHTNTIKNTFRTPEPVEQKAESISRKKSKKEKEPDFEVVNTTEKKDDGEKKETKKPKSPKQPKPQRKKEPFVFDPRVKWGFGAFLICVGLYLLIAFLINLIGQPYDTDLDAQSTGKAGGFVANFLLKGSFGLGSFYIVAMLFMFGLSIFLQRIKLNGWKIWEYALVGFVWIPLFFGYVIPNSVYGGSVGKWYNYFCNIYIGDVGTILLLLFTAIIYFIVTFKDSLIRLGEKIRNNRLERERQRIENEENKEVVAAPQPADEPINKPLEEEVSEEEIQEGLGNIELVTELTDEGTTGNDEPLPLELDTEVTQETDVEPTDENPSEGDDITLDVQETEEEETKDEIEHFGIDVPYDPHLDLADYQFPSLDILTDYGDGKANVEVEELEANKNKIVKTLSDYSIGIDKIKATIGPTVTLYEIVPSAGVRISKIKGLGDDIALSLAALGIRIIAPIPGKGTIGIEVPNSNPKTVSMKSVLSSEKFQNNNFALPFAMGKTITNETYVADLAKMPHILMAGATGQGKSVGLNAIIASLLYSKHPTELKFVLVDPKKVELSLFNKIERHYLAKLPDAEDAIITDTKRVVRTLNSLCIEMDNRYELLKDAQVRNIKEYNAKFISRHLNPNNGHHFLPYIVLVVDEFADLMITAGKDVEKPIMRLAQLSRAIGIHLIIATQRPSVNVITGSIKANFPARIAFRVMQRVDSHTILDASGAEQLVGKGDMLISTGNDLVRLQCAFIDTPEVEALTEFIGSQRGFSDAYYLPEVPDDDANGQAEDFDDGERDPLFEDAAYIVVQTQQGSTSMLQRKLKLGYNRAGRIIDQLEAAGIVGPFAGSKTREVKIANEMALEQFLKDLNLDKTENTNYYD